MRWLLLGEFDEAFRAAVRERGDAIVAGPEADEIQNARTREVIAFCTQKGCDVMTTRVDMARDPFEQHLTWAGRLVYFQCPPTPDALVRLFDRYSSPAIRRLFTITGKRVKIRQLPAEH